MRRVLLVAVLALGMAQSPAFAQAAPPAESASAPAAPSSPPSSPAPSSTAAAPARKRHDEVTEYVLYRGAFEDENKQALMSDAHAGLVQFCYFQELQKAQLEGRARPVLSVGARKCTYPLDAKGKRQAHGSECVETEIEVK